MSKYTTLLFDVDNTLLNFDYAEEVSIVRLFKEYNLPYDKESIDLYHKANLTLWKKHERGEIPAEGIYEQRFIDFLNTIGRTADPVILNKKYLGYLSECSKKMDGCDEIIDYLYGRYEIDIVTNGFAENQHRRMNDSGLINKVKHLFISGEMGCQKPTKEFFDIVFSTIDEKDRSKILIIGDSLTSDIKGGRNAGIDTCFITNGKSAEKDCATYVIENLYELKNIL